MCKPGAENRAFPLMPANCCKREADEAEGVDMTR